MTEVPASDTLIGRRLAATAKAVRAYTEHRMSSAGGSLSTVIIIRILAAEPGLSQRELAQRMDLQSPTVMRHLDRMEDDGLITRVRDESDRRVLRVQLTAKGRSARKRLERAASDAHHQVTSVFTPEELSTFEDLLDRLADRSRELLTEEVTP